MGKTLGRYGSSIAGLAIVLSPKSVARPRDVAQNGRDVRAGWSARQWYASQAVQGEHERSVVPQCRRPQAMHRAVVRERAACRFAGERALNRAVNSVVLSQTSSVVTPQVMPVAYTRAMVVLCGQPPNQPVKRTRGAASSSFASAFCARRLPAIRSAS